MTRPRHGMVAPVHERLDAAIGQLDYAVAIVRRLLEGMTDDELLWEPVAGCWSVRRDGDGGTWRLEVTYPDPVPPPFTTIAWLTHLTQATHVVAHAVRDEPVTSSPAVAGAAADATAAWERAAADLRAALAEAASDDVLDRGDTVPWETEPAPVSDLVWIAAIHETIHHGAEIGRTRHWIASASRS